MSIKQNGGVFGRNPTFNDVTIEGDLIINGEVFTGLDFQGSWNASTNSPTLASSTGTKGEFYIVSVAGTTDLNGITNWGIGDWALFNGTVWQRVEGGADGNFDDLTANTLTVTGAATASSLNLPNAADWSYIKNNTANGGLRLGTQNGAGVYSDQIEMSAGGDYVKLNANVPITGNLVISTSGKGIDFSATSGTGTSELLSDYEQGNWTPTYAADGGGPTVTYSTQTGTYTKIGRVVTITCSITINTVSGGSGTLRIYGLPFNNGTNTSGLTNGFVYNFVTSPQQYNIGAGLNSILLYQNTLTNTLSTAADLQASAYLFISGSYTV
tara:strand:- start:1631 stop:2608 length:978 start_codon:yes stop_codon:yes gene_type:complete